MSLLQPSSLELCVHEGEDALCFALRVKQLSSFLSALHGPLYGGILYTFDPQDPYVYFSSAKLRPPWVAKRASRATSGRIERSRQTQCGRTVHTAVHAGHWRRQMVRPP